MSAAAPGPDCGMLRAELEAILDLLKNGQRSA
jgi:hypothetical protein